MRRSHRRYFRQRQRPFPRRNPHKLFRSADDRMVAGVCGGVADYFDVEPLLVRLAAIAGLIFFFPFALFGYFAMAVLLEEKPEALYRDEYDEAFWRSVSVEPRETFSGLRQKFRELDKRLESLERGVTDDEFALKRKFKDLEA